MEHGETSLWSCSCPVWNGKDFSLCFENIYPEQVVVVIYVQAVHFGKKNKCAILFWKCGPNDCTALGLAANLITVVLVVIRASSFSLEQKKGMLKILEAHNIKWQRFVELLPAVAATLSIIKICGLILSNFQGEAIPLHLWLYATSLLFSWVFCCAVLHKNYELVLGFAQVLRIWWFLSPLFHIPRMRTIFISAKVVWSVDSITELILCVISMVFGTLIIILGWKVSMVPASSHMDDPELRRHLLHEEAAPNHVEGGGFSLWSLLLFLWVSPVMNIGCMRQICHKDLFSLPKILEPKLCFEALWRCWSDEQKTFPSKPSFFRSIYYSYRWNYLRIGIVKMINDALGFAGPLLLNKIVQSLQNGLKANYILGFWCAFSLGITSAVRAFLGTQYTFLVLKLKLQLRASITTLVYRKALCVSLSERSCFSSGEVQTLMSVDAERTIDLFANLHDLWSLPLQMTVAMTLLYTQVKYAFIAGLAVIILLIPVNRLIAQKISRASQIMMKEKDERVRKTSELLTYIRTIKMYTWEKLFSARVEETREKELKQLGVQKYLDAWCVYFWATTPILFSFFTFGLYTLLGHRLDAATVFTSLALFNMLISPLNSFPWVINGLIEATISLKRLNRFLSSSEIKSEWTRDTCSSVQYPKLKKASSEGMEDRLAAVAIDNADFTWTDSSKDDVIPILNNISFAIPEGSLVVVLGEVGAGKSSLLGAILGEMRCMKGNISCHGRIAYVPQIPWIQYGSVRDNIIFGQAFNDERYAMVVTACALNEDVNNMVGGDLSTVGERGFNLSGGQRARLALARALYQDCDIYLLDDPLSSVDAHVSSWILEHAFQGPLMYKKTIIISTYNSQVLSKADMIIWMEKGGVRWIGTISELRKYVMGNDFSETYLKNMFMENHLQAGEENLQLTYSSRENSSNILERESNLFILDKNEVSLLQENPMSLVDEEDRVVGTVRASVFWAYAGFVGWLMMSIILFSTTLMQISRNGNDLWLAHWVGGAFEEDSSHYTDLYYLKVLCMFSVANSIFTFVRSFSFANGGLRAAVGVHQTLLHQLVQAPIHFFDRNPTGRILNRFSSDQYTIDDSLPFIANIVLANFFSLAGTLFVVCFVQWSFFLFILPLGYIYFRLQTFYRATSRELRRLDSTSRSPIYTSFTEVLEGSPTIRAFQVQTIFTDTNYDIVAVNQRASYWENAASLWLSIRLQLMASFIVFFISMMAFMSTYRNSAISSQNAGFVGLAISYASPIISLLNDLLSTFTETEKEMVSVERVQQYMDLEAEKNSESLQVDPSWPSIGCLEFQHVTVIYMPLCPPALKDISFFIQGGAKVGIAGRTGAGKSSILNALFRLLTLSEGKILIDGVDTADLSLHQLRSKLSVVPQSPFLFVGTVRENLDPMGRCSDDRLWEVLQKCHLKEAITAAGGLDSIVKEGGESLSLGQRQLLCLCRSLLHHVKILCLDECTANVDPQTTLVLKKTVASECKGMTVLTIAHRISMIKDLDHVLILENGILVEQGNPHILMSRKDSVFAGLANASFE